MSGLTRAPALLILIALAASGLVLAPGASAERYVSGEVSGAWTAAEGPYVVTDDIFVPPAAVLSIGPGVVVRFNAGTALRVHGELLVAGSDLAPVEFTSNGSTVAGSWVGILVQGRATVRSASVAFAATALQVEHGSASVEGLVATRSFVGILANGTALTVRRSAVTLNEGTGLLAIDASVAIAETEFASNAVALDLRGSSVTIKNGTVSGSFAWDASLEASTLSMLSTPTGRAYDVTGPESWIEERWFADILVRDKFGTPVPSASLTVEGPGLPAPLQRTAEADGWARWLELLGMKKTQFSTFAPTYLFTASARGSTGTRNSPLGADVALAIDLSADVTGPAAAAGADLTVDEDAPVAFNATGSTDNDPAFPAGATFTWRFDDNGRPVSLGGPTTTVVFATPGIYPVVLEVTDAAGNTGLDLRIVTVRDRTVPSASIALPPRVTEGESAVLDARGSTDNDPAFNETGNFTWTIESRGSSMTVYGRAAPFSGFWGAGVYTVTLRVRDAGGNEAVATATLEVVPAPLPDFAWLAAALAAWFAAMGVWGTERGRMAFISFLVLPLFTRMRKEDVLDQFTRGQIYGYIVVHPGDSYSDIKRNLQLNNGTLTHHLNVLERDGMVASKTVGTRRLFYAKGARVPEDGGGMHEVQQQILRQLRETGGLAVNDVAGSLGISRQLAIYHLRDLSRKGLVRIERRAFRIVAYAEDPRPRNPS